MNALADGIAIAAITITSSVVLARVHYWTYILKQRRGRLEAAFVIIGFALYIGFVYCLLHVSRVEIGWWVHQWDVTVGDRIGFSYWVFIAGVLYNAGIAPLKVAIVMEWLRVFSPQPRSAFYWLCYISIWLNITYYVAAIIVESIQCTPHQFIWDRTLKGTCLSPKAAEAIAWIDVVSDIVLMATPQVVIWRPALSTAKKAGVAVIFAVGLFGTISAIFQLIAIQSSSKSDDSTYSVSPIRFWALSEMSSVILVYGLPAVPTAFASAFARVLHCYGQWAQNHGFDGSVLGHWRGQKKDPSKRYTNLDRTSVPGDMGDTATTRCISVIENPVLIRPPEPMCVIKTIEIRRDEIRADGLCDIDKDIEEDVLLRQHPWVRIK
ncbi:hypothetical protein F5B22DRAFT_285286 [Xylaria bambusicola]|uniref:uncharacterized protein n=1 Tax=Xylaria bambusicola TaxID=326684 RepID=UPI002007CB8C|nr:uncharacterized protein F5B22DRAFT_285286 [Xylaria bambusicola]KAI0513050.1 hypothetical protein F5B22DRAFT_285286 [Xylaria bambusicola]